MRDDQPALLERDTNIGLTQRQVTLLLLNDVLAKLPSRLRNPRCQNERLEVVSDPWVIDVLEAVDQWTAGEDGDPLEGEGVRAEQAGREWDGEPEAWVALQVGCVEVEVALIQGGGRGLGGDLLCGPG